MPVKPAPLFTVLVGIPALVIGAVVVYYAMIFDGPFPDHPLLRGHNDLVLHIAAFLALSTPVLLLDSRSRSIVGLVLFAGAIEIVQIFLPHRTPDWLDFAGSVAGIALAALVAGGLRWIGKLVASRGAESDE